MVTLILFRERPVVERLQRAGAVSADSARSLAEMDLAESRTLSRLQARGVVREAEPGRFYVDQLGWNAFRWARLRIVLILIAVAIIALFFLPSDTPAP